MKYVLFCKGKMLSEPTKLLEIEDEKFLNDLLEYFYEARNKLEPEYSGYYNLSEVAWKILIERAGSDQAQGMESVLPDQFRLYTVNDFAVLRWRVSDGFKLPLPKNIRESGWILGRKSTGRSIIILR